MRIARYFMNEESAEEHPNGAWVTYDDHVAEVERIKAERYPLLTADDPEPAVGSVVQDGEGIVAKREGNGWHLMGFVNRWSWAEVAERQVRLLWDGASE